MTNLSKIDYEFEFDNWVDLMKAHERVYVPSYIEFRENADSNDLTKRPILEATLDDLATGIVNVEEEIERLEGVKAGLRAIQKRVRRYSIDGRTTIARALFPDP